MLLMTELKIFNDEVKTKDQGQMLTKNLNSVGKKDLKTWKCQSQKEFYW